uniref:Uncharacterized protein n=1 Tax=Cajanus cajan TaxID=3821 RepID=A0A151TIR2_CAJCA|nr:hypothetical protein KK1_013259 [Cajanus cajan]
MSTKRKRTFDARGDIVDTEVNLYGSGNRGGFVVLELKKNSRDEKCNAATLAHYFANSDGAVFSRTGKDIGLSVVVKILASNGNLDIVMEGPQKHPSAALFYMFNEVYKTGIWKPTMCPHCSNVGNDGALVRHGKTGIIILEDEDN